MERIKCLHYEILLPGCYHTTDLLNVLPAIKKKNLHYFTWWWKALTARLLSHLLSGVWSSGDTKQVSGLCLQPAAAAAAAWELEDFYLRFPCVSSFKQPNPFLSHTLKESGRKKLVCFVLHSFTGSSLLLFLTASLALFLSPFSLSMLVPFCCICFNYFIKFVDIVCKTLGKECKDVYQI